jgi:hypothetical protein
VRKRQKKETNLPVKKEECKKRLRLDGNTTREAEKKAAFIICGVIPCGLDAKIRGGSNMTGTNCDLFTHK